MPIRIRTAMEQTELRKGERIDDLQRNGRAIIQNPSRFCFGIDAVLLSGFARVKKGERLIDLGSGNGILPILLEAKNSGRSYTGLEIQPENVEMAARSARLNGTDNISFVEGDMCRASEIFGKNSCEVVVSNPPYMKAGGGEANPADSLAVARHEIRMTLSDLVRETAALLTGNGRCYYVHRPQRLADIICLMREYRVEPKRLRLVYPYADREPVLVLIEGRKNGNPELRIERPLILYEAPGVYTQEMRENYGF